MIPGVVFCTVLAGDDVQPLTLPQVLKQMEERDRVRSACLAGYTCKRRYMLENRRFHKTAELTVLMTYTWPGHKKFEVLSEQGSSVVRQRVLRRMLEAEEEASGDEPREKSRITPLNYNFKLLSLDPQGGRSAWVLEITPKASNKFLIRGRIWVDSRDFAIVRVEATPAQSPSTWIHNTRIVQQYAKFGGYWLPVLNHSESDSLIFGRTEVKIESSDYKITSAPRGAGGAACPTPAITHSEAPQSGPFARP